MESENFLELCTGRYCGRIKNDTNVWGECTACPIGFRTDELKLCQKCVNSPELYHWMYLGFMAILPLSLNWLCILSNYSVWSSPAVIVQMISSFIESCMAALFALLVYEPKGSLNLVSCPVVQISDWYTVFFNPTVKYTTTIFCGQEAVYPLYSIIFVCYLLSLGLMVVIRPIAYYLIPRNLRTKMYTKTLYATLYLHPILVAIHAVFAGLIYYSFPYLTVLATMVAMVKYYVGCDAMTIQSIFGQGRGQHIFVLIWHLLVLCAAVIPIILTSYPALTFQNLLFLLCTPFPLVFFLLTEHFSDPKNIAHEMVIT
uniref:JNK1/MAPK8-associated membrane protein n=1 Tax=Ciona savignyi TaxID=51511 RepID=H2YRZ5_CIOSA